MNEGSETMETKAELSAEEARKQEREGTTYQITMSLCANMSVLGPSMGFGYSAVALGPLMSPTSDVKINSSQANWIATAAALGIPIGCVLSSIIMRRGRKPSLLATSILSIIGWLTIYVSNSYEQILVGRVISGVATGLASVPACVYSAEIAGPKWRGTMVTWTSVTIAAGVLVVYTFGYIFKENWRAVAVMCAICPVISMALTMTVLPESPIWLRDRGRLEEALVVMKKFRGVPENAPVPTEILLELHPRRQKKSRNPMKHLLRRNALIPFAIMLAYFMFQQFSGIFVVVYYAVDIIANAGIKMDPYLGAVLIGVTRFVGSLLVAGVSHRLGRRLPSIVSGAGMTLFIGALAVYLCMVDEGDEGDETGGAGVIPTVCVLMYILMSTVGFLVIPFAMVGEIYPTKARDVLSGLTTCIAYVFSSVTIKTYPDMVRLAGSHGVFFTYATVSLLGTVFLVAFLPETRGKTLHEIEDMFAKKKTPGLDEPREKESIVALKDLAEPV